MLFYEVVQENSQACRFFHIYFVNSRMKFPTITFLCMEMVPNSLQFKCFLTLEEECHQCEGL